MNAQTTILERVIEPEADGLATDFARYLLTLGFRPTDQQRMDELSEKAQAGSLTPEEQEELDAYLHVSHFLALLQSKARRSLNNAGSLT